MSEENGNGAPKRLTKSERLRNYAGAIAILAGALPAIGALVVSIVTTFRGEPVAEQTWKTLQASQNEQAKAVNKLHLQLVHLHGFQEGQSAARLQSQLEDLQKKYNELKNKDSTAAKTPTSSPVKITSKPKCDKDGYVLVENQCRRVPKKIAKVVKDATKQVADSNRKLRIETIKRKMAERKAHRVQQTVKSPLLKMLPERLDDAMRKK